MTYRAPVQDLMFDIRHLAGLEQIATYPGLQEAGLETAQAVLEESARFNQEVVAPLNQKADEEPSALHGDAVTTSVGFKAAYAQYIEAGWQGLSHPESFGGQGLPKTIAAACIEILQSANLSFGLCPLLTDGAIEALLTAGSAELQKKYLPNLVAGRWTGTMNLTEPQAGSDLAAVRTRAEPQADGTYKVFGTKIFITYGEHDLAENIIHLVLARVPGAPEGIAGISLFVVPKFLVTAEGGVGARNDVHCTHLEHKLGIKASPTAVLHYGDHGGATGYLVGEENHGLQYMFIMMNAARYAVGVQGVAVAERAYQKAVAYARERVQSRPVDKSARTGVAIIEHPDVRRMLMTMRALTQGGRALAIAGAGLADTARHHPDQAERERARAAYEFLVPITKGFCTENSVEVASLGVQVHGGMGFIEETGAAQYYRDARILPIYEGTTAIQSNDLLGRKVLRDGGALALTLADQIAATEAKLARGSAAAKAVATQLARGRTAYADAVRFLVAQNDADVNAVYGASVPFLMLAGHVMAAWQLARSLLAAETALQAAPGEDAGFLRAKVATARFYAEHLLPRAGALRDAIVLGAQDVMALDTAQF